MNATFVSVNNININLIDMKKVKQIALSVLGMAFIAAGFVACSSDDSENVYNSSEETYESISSMTTLSQKQNAFDYLTNQEKYNVWQYKYDSFLNENELDRKSTRLNSSHVKISY